MRRDIHVPNESDGFVFTSAAMRARGISPGDTKWNTAVGAGDLLPLVVESEDPANVRIVVGESLTSDEQAEWVSLVRSTLRVLDGTLTLCGGIAYVLDEGAWAEEYARTVEIPAGTYRASLYCYASAPNGRLSIERTDADEPLGAWFRRTRSGQAMPTWLHNLCVHDPSNDPDHAKEWKRAKERSGGAVVDFVLHLEAADGAHTIAPVTEEGFMEPTEYRKPDVFPLGVTAIGLDGEEPPDDGDATPGEESASLLPAPPTGDLTHIAGGPVQVPITKLARLAQIAWMCHAYTHPALHLTFSNEPSRLDLDEIEDVTVAIAGNETRITFANNGQPADALAPLTAVSKLLGAVPDGTIVEFLSARLKTKSPLGAHRYRGTVQGGVLHIDASQPRVDAPTLTEALSLAEALETGRRLTARDEDEAARIEAHVVNVLADSFGGNGLQRTGTELALRRRDPALFRHIVTRAFWSRYAQTWPLEDQDAGQ